MADDSIIQKMGFEAGPAIASINSLKTALDSLNATLGKTGSELRSWNTGGKGASKMFDNMQKSAESLLAGYNSLAKAQANISAGTRGGGAALPTGGIESQLNLIQQLTGAWGAIPATASASSRQAFAQGQAGLAQFANTNKMSAQQILQAFTTMGSGTKGVTGQMGAQFAALSNAQKAMVAQVLSGNQSMTISFGTLFKIMQFRILISAITSLTQKFREGVTAGADFSRQLGMIQTVAGKGANMGKVSGQLEDLSRMYASPVGETASAYYLILQNQVGDAAQSMLFLEEAMKLHIATGASAKEASDTLTTAFNSMGGAAKNSAADLSGKLFKAMEIGRFEFKEMGNTIGVIGSLATELGVSTSEILGPVSTLTRNGVSFTKAITEMRAILSQTLKPTDALKKIFKDWGVEDAQQAISKFGGLMPMMKALESATHGSTSELAQAFTNLRALTGAVSILGDNYQDAVNDTKAIENATGDLTNKVAGMVQETQGMKFDKVINAIKTDFAKLGESALPTLNALLSVLQKLTESFKGAGSALTSGGLLIGMGLLGSGAVSLYKVVAGFEKLAPLLAGLKVAGPVALLTALSYYAGRQLGHAINIFRGIGDESAAIELNTRLLAQQDKDQKDIAARAVERSKTQVAANKTITDGLVSGLTATKAAYADADDAILNHNRAMVNGMKGSLETLINRQTTLVNKLRELSDEDGTKMNAAVTKRNQTAMAASDKAFGFQIDNLSSVRKSIEQTKRSQDSMNMAMSKARQAQSPEDYAEVDRLLQRAASYAGEASSSAGTEYANRVRLYQARLQEMNVANAMTEVDNARIATQSQVAAKAAAALDIEEKTLEVMKENVATILEGASLYTGPVDNMRKKTDAELKASEEAADKARARLVKRMQEPGVIANMKDADMLGLSDLVQKRDAMFKDLPRMFATVDLDYKTSYNELTTRFQKTPFTAKVILDYDIQAMDYEGSLARASTKVGEQIDNLQNTVNAEKDKIEALRSAVAERNAAFSADLGAIDSPATAALNRVREAPISLGKQGQAYTDAIQAAQDLMQLDPADTVKFQVALDTLSKSLDTFKNLRATEPTNLGKNAFFAGEAAMVKFLNDTLTDLKPKLADLNAGRKEAKDAGKEILQLQKLQEDFRTKSGVVIKGQEGQKIVYMDIAASATTIATGTATTNTEMKGIATNSGVAAANYERIKKAQNYATVIAATKVKNARNAGDEIDTLNAELGKIKGSPKTPWGDRKALTPAATAYQDAILDLKALYKIPITQGPEFDAATAKTVSSIQKFQDLAAKGGIGTGFTPDPAILAKLTAFADGVVSNYDRISASTDKANTQMAQVATTPAVQPLIPTTSIVTDAETSLKALYAMPTTQGPAFNAALTATILKLQAVKDAAASGAIAPLDPAKLATLNASIEQLKAAQAELARQAAASATSTTTMSTSLGTAAGSAPTIASAAGTMNTGFTGAATAASSLASSLQAAALASSQIQVPPVVAAKGGYMRFAAGGKAQGTDTIPAMLSPGEFVVNARSTRQFFSQLVAMNAGVKPIYRQDGGAVTNIGDINVTVPGGPTTRQTAREIATALRREVRRGTSKL